MSADLLLSTYTEIHIKDTFILTTDRQTETHPQISRCSCCGIEIQLQTDIGAQQPDFIQLNNQLATTLFYLCNCLQSVAEKFSAITGKPLIFPRQEEFAVLLLF